MATIAQPSYRQRVAYHAGLLGGICFLVSVLLIIGDRQTSNVIATHLENEKRASLAQVLPAGLYDNQPLDAPRVLPPESPFTQPLAIYTATRDGQYSGAALQSAVYGWGGDIRFIIAVDASGTITGVRVLSHTETPGLADKIEVAKDDWITRFNGLSLDNTPHSGWAVKKDAGVIDQFTGATITPRAVVRGVHQSLMQLQRWRLQQQSHEQSHAALEPQAEDNQP